MMIERDQLLSLLVAVAREAALRPQGRAPVEGDLVVEISNLFGTPDPDAIGFLQGHGEATYSVDNTGPSREVWDVRTLSGRGGISPGVRRWENAEFLAVPYSRLANELVADLRNSLASQTPQG